MGKGKKGNDDDDVSSLGEGEADVELPQTMIEAVADIEEERKRVSQEYEMVVNGFKCPDEYINVLTPMEFEELVKMFMEFDVDGSKTIDKVTYGHF